MSESKIINCKMVEMLETIRYDKIEGMTGLGQDDISGNILVTYNSLQL